MGTSLRTSVAPLLAPFLPQAHLPHKDEEQDEDECDTTHHQHYCCNRIEPLDAG